MAVEISDAATEWLLWLSAAVYDYFRTDKIAVFVSRVFTGINFTDIIVGTVRFLLLSQACYHTLYLRAF